LSTQAPSAAPATTHQARLRSLSFAAGLSVAICLLLSLAQPAGAADVVETASNAGTFKVFLAALKNAGFTDTLRAPGPYTVFAPTDEAFAKLPAGTWEAVSKDKVYLSKVLARHVVPGKILIAEIKPGKIKTTQGDLLTLTSDNGKVTVNAANIIESDMKADNGVVHALDAVLLPENALSSSAKP
jgi:uncharacterized surface protein with fasciclin (FAS1) repeats